MTAATEEEIAAWAIDSYQGPGQGWLVGAPTLMPVCNSGNLAGSTFTALQGFFVKGRFLRKIAAAISDVESPGRPYTLVTNAHQEEAYRIWRSKAEQFVREMYAEHDNGRVPFGERPELVERWVQQNRMAASGDRPEENETMKCPCCIKEDTLKGRVTVTRDARLVKGGGLDLAGPEIGVTREHLKAAWGDADQTDDDGNTYRNVSCSNEECPSNGLPLEIRYYYSDPKGLRVFEEDGVTEWAETKKREKGRTAVQADDPTAGDLGDDAEEEEPPAPPAKKLVVVKGGKVAKGGKK